MKYTSEDLTVNWKSDICIHAEECVKGSPDVFKLTEKPWVQIEGSNVEMLMATIDKCPSGALSYTIENKANDGNDGDKTLRVKISKNGPLLVSGRLELEDAEGTVKTCEGKMTALCRCGASANKPFCDGSHKEIDFVG